jgi:hypothetical protein
MSKNKQKETCLACNKAFNKSDFSIQCAICALWIHHKPSSSVSDDGFKFLSEQVQATGNAYWACRACMAYSKAITTKVKEVERKLEEVHKEVKEHASELVRVDKNVEQLRQDLEKVKERNKEESNNFITAEEYRERESRRLNVIMHRVPESLAREAETRRKADLLECSNILRSIGLGNRTADVKLCRRLGERGDEPRPLIIILRNESTRTALLESARLLRNTDYVDVSIVPNLTLTQRNEEAALHEEMDRRNRDDLTTDDAKKNLRWNVVGPRGARRIIKTTARDWPQGNNTRGRGRGQPPRATARSAAGVRLGTPVVPIPTGRGQPVIRPVTLLPPPDQQASRKRTRERMAPAAAVAAATPTTEQDEEWLDRDDPNEATEEEEMEDETRTPPSKR